MTNIKIVADSSADLYVLEGADFAVAPLKIVTTEKEYVDDVYLNLRGMIDDLKSYRGKSSTSCPNTDDFIGAFGSADNVFCITITGTLSGSYNAARLAGEMYEEANPGKKVFVLHSLSTGPEMALIIDKVVQLAHEDKSFEEICEAAQAYAQKTGLLFMLASLQNLANNGRVTPLVAKMAGILGIRLVGKASDVGDLEPMHKCRGEKKALDTIVSELGDLGYNGKKVYIGHCFNEEAGISLMKLIQKKYKEAQVELYPLGALCSFYAEEGGLLVGFEKE